jgi:hypothetical protein
VDRAVLLSRLNDIASPWDSSWDLGFPTQVYNGRFELRGGDSRTTYPVFVVDPKHGWGAMAQVSVGQAGGKPATVRLQKCGSLTVRFVDRKGQPVPEVLLYVNLEIRPLDYAGVGIKDLGRMMTGSRKTRELGLRADDVPVDLNLHSDAQGRITLPAMIPGATYWLRWTTNKRTSLGGLKKVKVKAGQALDLGDLRVSP